MNFRKTSVFGIVIIALVAVTTSVLGTLGAINYLNTRSLELEHLRIALALDADQIAPSLDLPVWNFEKPEIDKVVESMMLDPILQGIVVKSADNGTVICARERDARGNVQVVKAESPAAGLLMEKRDVTFANQAVATVTLFGMTKSVDLKLESILAWTIFNILSLDLILIIGLYLLLWWLVFKPLKKLERHAALVSTGSGVRSAAIQGLRFRGELESLRISLEKMFSLLNLRYQELHDSEEKFSKAFQSNPSSIAITEMETGHYIEVNESSSRIWGYPKQEMVGHSAVELGIWKSKEDRDRMLKLLLVTGTLRGFETSGHTRDRHIRNVLMNAELIELGGKRCIVSSLQDITEQKRTQVEMIWKTALLQAQVDSSLDGILVVDDSAKRILQNQRLCDLFKVPNAIARDDDDAKLLRYVTEQAKHPKQFVERVTYLYAHPEEVGRDEIELVDGQIFDRYSAPVRDHAGKYYGRIWTFRDITAQRKLEEQFRQSQKMEAFGQFASGVAHDFNNILAVIQLQSELLMSDDGLSGKQKEYAADIGDSAQRAAALTRQLLLFSRKEKMQTRAQDFNQCINDLTKMLRRTIGADIQLQFRFALHSLIVRADPGMMDQVLMNLVVNARDAMPKGGDIIIKTGVVELDEASSTRLPQSRPGSFVCLSVSDTGCGIPPENIQKIFEPFFTTKEVGKGTGLGLATVFGIVQQHHGWVSVHSEVGRGTTFEVYLPRLAEGTDANAKTTHDSQTSIKGGDETILVVEDEFTLRTSLRNTLTKIGYRVLEAGTGAEALKIWSQYRAEIALLLTDLVMPGGMTGKELAGNLLQQEPKLKVIYMSGYSADTANKDFLIEEGVNFFTKPFPAHKLAHAIRNALAQ